MPYWPHDTTLWVNTIHGNDPTFVYYWLQTLGLGQYDVGAANPTLNRNHLHLLPTVVPHYSTQRKIASILSAYDALIENNDRRIKISEEISQRIYREWFVEFRYPGHQDVPLKDSALGLVPMGWRPVTLAEVCARITDGAHRSPPSVTQGRPMASVKDMTPRSLDMTDCRLISEADYEELVRQDSRPRAGDVLVSKDGAHALRHVFPMFQDSAAVILSSIAVLRPSLAIRPELLALTLREPAHKERLKGFVSGAAIPRVVLKDFKLFRFMLPPTELQASSRRGLELRCDRPCF